MLRTIGLVAITVLLALVLASCGGKSGANLTLTEPGSQHTTIAPPPRNLSVEEAVAQVEKAPVPEGVDAELFAQLKDQLIRQLRATSADKVTAGPPMHDYNQVSDLQLLGNPTDGLMLKWTYINRGDYNLDGLVSINDLTPIGLHFNHTQDMADWGTAKRADGNEDGFVTINDITPIGQNYLNYIVGYNVYGGAAADGPWEMLGSMELPDAPTMGRFVLTFDLPDTADMYFQIRPYDDMGAEGIASQVSMPTVEPKLVQLGADTYDVTQMIGPAGGTIGGQLGLGGPIVEVNFPPGAVGEDHQFRLGTNDGSYDPPMGELHSPIIAMDTDGVRNFKQVVTIQVSYDREDYGNAIVPFIVNDDGSLELIDLISQDSKLFQAQFQTYQLHKHLIWLVQELAISQYFGIFRTIAFDPARDGLQVVNTGSLWHPGGECFGMTSFAEWYYINEMSTQGDLYPRFMYIVPIYGGLSGQRIICTRSFTSIAKEWDTYWNNFVGPQGGLNDAQRFASICCGIENAGHPVLVDLRHENGTGGAHSVLAYKYSATNLWIYDPNHPGVERTIEYNPGSGTFTPYGGYDSIRYSGSGALWLDEPYLNLLTDAEHQFADNGYATINITSHASGQHVPVGLTTVTGTVESTVELVDDMQLSVGDQYWEFAIPPDGHFSRIVYIAPGTNTFYFSTWATRLDDTVVFVPHDLGGGAFTLYGE